MPDADRPLADSTSAMLSQLPEWARTFLSERERPAAPPEAKPTDYVGKPAWQALLDAAVVSSFLPRELFSAPPSEDGERRSTETAVLRFSERVHDPDGPKWVLTPNARTAVLAAAKKDEIDQAVERTAPHFADPISKALRDQLSGFTVDFGSLALPVLEATRIAAGWLRGVPGERPSLDTLDRAIAFRRLLKPFNRMIYVDSKDDEPGRKVRFYGRDSEMAELRRYVGVIDPNRFTRFITRLGQRFLGLGADLPMVVWGIGGVGKTTLIAKFMLEHAEAAASQFPFAYLDFDRPLISARQPSRLLTEMCSHVEAQFPTFAEPLRQLRSKAAALASELDRSAEKALEELDTFQLLGPLLEDFRRIIDDHIAQLEATTEFERPFLLIFDTFEIVQYSEKDVRRLETFLRKLTRSRDGRGWTRLRLIISGRSKPRNFLSGVNEIPLRALDRDGSIEMLMALADDAGHSFDHDSAGRLVDAIVKSMRGPANSGCHPLSLRLVGQVLKGEKEPDGRKLVEDLVTELARPAGEGSRIRSQLIEGILVRRVLDHVGDARVRALADPGLVVRRITPQVIREVMARGTPSPDTDPKLVEGDADGWKPWELTPQEADDIFGAFGREVSIIERHDRDPTALWHRQDLRQETLPLIRDRRPRRFQRLQELAYDFFRRQIKANANDHDASGQAIYHGLWLSKPIEDLDRLWVKGPDFDPRIDPAEFEDQPAAQRYLKAKTLADLPAGEIAQLPPAISLEWLRAKVRDFLDDERPNEALDSVRAAAGRSFERLDGDAETAADVARLVYRTGRWAETRDLAARQLGGPEKLPAVAQSLASLSASTRDGEAEDRLSLLRTWVTVAAKSGAEETPLVQASVVGKVLIATADPMIGIELLSFAVLGANLLRQRSGQSEIPASLSKRVLSAALKVPRDHWRRSTRALRFATLAAGDDAADLMAIYLATAPNAPREEELLPLVANLLCSLYEESGNKDAIDQVRKLEKSRRPEDVARGLAVHWTKLKQQLIDSLQRPQHRLNIRRIILADHHDWIRPLGHALERELRGSRAAALAKALNRKNVVDATEGTGIVSHDGIALVNRAAADGKLLRLAAALSDEASRDAGQPAVSDNGYPQDAYAIAGALLRWHKANLAAIDESAPPS